MRRTGEHKPSGTGLCQTRRIRMSFPKNNPFVTVTPELMAKTEANLHKELAREVSYMCNPGDGEEGYVRRRLEVMQSVLKKFREFGFLEVRLVDESKFPVLIEAIGPLKRAGLSDEIRRIMMNILTSCGIPEAVLNK